MIHNAYLVLVGMVTISTTISWVRLPITYENVKVSDIMEAWQGYSNACNTLWLSCYYTALVSNGITLGHDSNTPPPHSVTMLLAST